MQDIRDRFEQIKEQWDAVYDTYGDSPASWEPYLPGSSLHDIDQAMTVLDRWINKQIRPKRDSAALNAIRSSLNTTLINIKTPLQQLQNGQFQQLPTFLVYLGQLFSLLHAMLAITGQVSDEALSAMSQEMLEVHASTKKVADELRGLVELCKNAEQWKDTAETASTTAKTSATNAEGFEEAAEASSTNAEVSATEAKEFRDAAEQNEGQLKKLVKEAADLKVRLIAQEKKLNALIEQASKDQKIISECLPEATSAGLAHSFAARADRFTWPKRGWALGFAISIGLLVYFGWDMFHSLLEITSATKEGSAPVNGDIWHQLLNRLPLLSPLFWFAWVCARQYGHLDRVQEDYAFKEAVSKAFEGYKKQMMEIDKVRGGAGELSKLLSVEVIQALSRDPQRIYDRKATDETPMHALLDRILPSKKKEQDAGE